VNARSPVLRELFGLSLGLQRLSCLRSMVARFSLRILRSVMQACCARLSLLGGRFLWLILLFSFSPAVTQDLRYGVNC